MCVCVFFVVAIPISRLPKTASLVNAFSNELAILITYNQISYVNINPIEYFWILRVGRFYYCEKCGQILMLGTQNIEKLHLQERNDWPIPKCLRIKSHSFEPSVRYFVRPYIYSIAFIHRVSRPVCSSYMHSNLNKICIAPNISFLFIYI